MLEFIKARLRKGDTQKIATKTNYSVSHVTNVLASRRNNEQIMKEAYKITVRRKANVVA